MSAGDAALERQTYSVEEAARVLGIGRAGAYRAIHAGELEATRIGKRLLVPHVAIQRLLQTKK